MQMGTKIVWTKPWHQSRGVWGAILGAAGTAYGLWAATMPCGFWQDFHNYASAAMTLGGAYLAFIGRRHAHQPIHFFWRHQKEVSA
jgi:hypothetical protein